MCIGTYVYVPMLQSFTSTSLGLVEWKICIEESNKKRKFNSVQDRLLESLKSLAMGSTARRKDWRPSLCITVVKFRDEGACK